MKISDGGVVGIVALAKVLDQLDEFRSAVEAQLKQLEEAA